MKKFFVFIVLTCVLGSRALAQSLTASNTETITEVLDFEGIGNLGDLNNNSDVSWSADNHLLSITRNGQVWRFLSSIDQHVRISVDNKSGMNVYNSGSDNTGPSYLQRAVENENRNVFIHNLKIGDVVKIYTEGTPQVVSGNTTTGGIKNQPYSNLQNGQELTVVDNSNIDKIQILLSQRWSGIHKIEITTRKQSSRFDYDPGFEVYDMWGTQNGSCSFTAITDKTPGFNLNGGAAQYIKIENYGTTLNNRLAVNPTSGWNAVYGLEAPSSGGWFSICNLREGDRVVLFYTGDAPTFNSSGIGSSGTYTGSAAYKDMWNDGVLNAEESDHDIQCGEAVEPLNSRPDGTIARSAGYDVELYTSYPYVVKENGHLDFHLNAKSRIVKFKIYSDHQAMMVDDADEENFTYKAYFNITGELQAKEHIVPGGLEVHVGNDNLEQHAIVVASKDGPVSYVNAVDGFKLPGLSKDNSGNIVFNFDLNTTAPTTGTYYKFKPEQNGTMTVNFQANSMNYYRYDLPGNAIYYDGGWLVEWDRPNEQTLNVNCPYYLVEVDENNGNLVTVTQRSDQILNGNLGSYTLNVEAGKVYYLYGGWTGISNSNRNWQDWGFGTGSPANFSPACGVAELLSIEFKPDKGVFPLAKWIPNNKSGVNNSNGVPNADNPSQTDYYLATVIGYSTNDLTVKKMSGNITQCKPYIQEYDGKLRLMISDIKYDTANKKNPGGTILIKIGDPDIKSSPLYALTIAYSADGEYDGENPDLSGNDKRGHVWDFSTHSLSGLKWGNDIEHAPKPTPQNGIFINNAETAQGNSYAVKADMGTYFSDYFGNYQSYNSSVENMINNMPKNTSSLLYEEMTTPDHHEIARSDWMFNYNLIYDGNMHDPVFQNKYDMEGDNADMIWDSEGTVFITSSNQSVIFNEYGNTVNHTEANDPDRYLGILEGGEFRIPWLEKDDRVIIWMGTGKGRYADEVKFSIENARDAEYKEIDPKDDYIVGGSHWDGKKGDPYYRGCYHFFATGDGNGGPRDMIFKMKEGSLCKIYKIQIYGGDRIYTNEIKGATTADKFLLWSRAHDPNEPTSETNKDYTEENRPNWTLQYFGKDQKLADGSNSVKNDIISKTGDLKNDITTNATDNTFTYEHELGEIGTFRMRGKDMEKNMKYVADYADRNVTVAYQETQPYPYTWDFMDVTGFSGTALLTEDQLEAQKPTGFTEEYWNSIKDTYYEITSNDLSLWEIDNANDGYYLRLNSQSGQTLQNLKEKDNIFETAKDIDGNQVWANKAVIPETKGLWFYTNNNNQGNGTWVAHNAGMAFNLSGGTLVVPNVPAGAAVYLRMEKTLDNAISNVRFKDGPDNSETYGPVAAYNNAYEFIYAIKNTASTKRHLVLNLYGYQLKKLGVSKDRKTLGKYGWATESRERVIDPSLTAYLSGKNIETIIATSSDYASRSVTLARMNLEERGDLMQATTEDGTKYACILHNADEEKPITVLDGGFHLFVPDMHDYDLASLGNSMKKFTHAEQSIMKAQLNSGQVMWSDDNGETKNFVLTASYLKVDKEDNVKDNTLNAAKEEGFYRVGKNNPITSNGHQGYLPVSTAVAGGNAKFSIVFGDFFDELQGIATDINDVSGLNDNGQKPSDDAVWYNLNGQKLNGKPSDSGIYIVNGKKIMVK